MTIETLEDIFTCPISKDRMQEPIVIFNGPLCGISIDKDSIARLKKDYPEYNITLDYAKNVDLASLIENPHANIKDFITLGDLVHPVIFTTGQSANLRSCVKLINENQLNPFTRGSITKWVPNFTLKRAIKSLLENTYQNAISEYMKQDEGGAAQPAPIKDYLLQKLYREGIWAWFMKTLAYYFFTRTTLIAGATILLQEILNLANEHPTPFSFMPRPYLTLGLGTLFCLRSTSNQFKEKTREAYRDWLTKGTPDEAAKKVLLGYIKSEEECTQHEINIPVFNKP